MLGRKATQANKRLKSECFVMQMGPFLEKTVASFHLLPPTENYVPPYKDPWRFWWLIFLNLLPFVAFFPYLLLRQRKFTSSVMPFLCCRRKSQDLEHLDFILYFQHLCRIKSKPFELLLYHSVAVQIYLIRFYLLNHKMPRENNRVANMNSPTSKTIWMMWAPYILWGFTPFNQI